MKKNVHGKMPQPASITRWIDDLRQGDADAASELWRRYGASLVRLAKQRLANTRQRVSDEEDVALTAFAQFCQGVQRGQFTQLNNRTDLWQLLVLLTTRRSLDQFRRERRRREQGESVLQGASDSSARQFGMQNVADSEDLPPVAVLAMDQCARLLESLPDEGLRNVAQWKLEGYTNDEIAERLGVVTRTVERKLQLIRRKWETFVAAG